MLRAAILTALSLITVTTAPGSAQRFDQVCSLLGEGIISGVWMYASEQPDVILASLDTLLPLVETLGIGTIRYLKVGSFEESLHP